MFCELSPLVSLAFHALVHSGAESKDELKETTYLLGKLRLPIETATAQLMMSMPHRPGDLMPVSR